MKISKREIAWDRVLTFEEGDRIRFEPGDLPYDPNDPEAAKAWLEQADVIYKSRLARRGKRGPQKTPTKKLVSLRLSQEVIEHFKSTGPGWQTRIDSTLLKTIKKRA